MKRVVMLAALFCAATSYASTFITPVITTRDSEGCVDRAQRG